MHSQTVKRLAAVIFGIIALVGISWLSVRTGSPTVTSPFPLAVVWPLLEADEHFGNSFHFMAYLAVPAAFLLWSFHLLFARDEIPRRSWVVFPVAVVANAIWCISIARFGLDYHGLSYTLPVIAIAILLSLAIVRLMISARRRATWSINYTVHLIFFAWLAWYAFPWLGELI
jgi:hypothetical protein